MAERAVSRSDAKLIAEAASECAGKALDWKARALKAEALLAQISRMTLSSEGDPDNYVDDSEATLDWIIGQARLNGSETHG